MTTAVTVVLWSLVVFCMLDQTETQLQPVSDQYTYFMDSNSNCGHQFEIGMNKAKIVGHGAAKSSSLLDCTITFTSIKINEERKFKIEVASAAIQSPGVKFYMYDSDRAEKPIDSFQKDDELHQNYDFKYTSGSFVTFQLKRVHASDFNYDIQVYITPISGDITFPDQCAGGQGYNCRPFYVYNPFTKEVIIGIVGGVFGLIIFIIIPLILFCCYRRAKGVNRRWDEHKLSTPHVNTAADIHSSNMSNKGTADTKSRDGRSKDLWTSQSSRAPFSSMPRGPRSRYSEDDDSVFEGSDIPPKRRPPPPPYEKYDSREDLDRRYNRNDRGRNMDSYRKPRGGPELYRNTSETSFVQSKDDHPQATFVERVIEPRVKKFDKTQNAQDDTYDIIGNEKFSREKDRLVEDHGIQCENESDSEEPRETESEEETETESEAEEDRDKKDMDSKSALYAKPNKQSQPDRPVPAERQSVKNPPSIENEPPRGVSVPQPVPINPVTGQPVPQMMGVVQPQRLPFQGYMMMPPRPMYPVSQPPFIQPGYQPMMARPGQTGPNQFQPIPAVHMHPRPMGNAKPQMQPPVIGTNVPPTYSHLVQRGYNPLDGRHSPASNSTQGSHDSRLNPTDDSNLSANLDSGVELMKRTTAV